MTEYPKEYSIIDDDGTGEKMTATVFEDSVHIEHSWQDGGVIIDKEDWESITELLYDNE